ncbi:MAG TPA: metallophosphoesterase [Solirubrobacteraceae bacterium]|nr:metallophosphoesterase [Solirubrobacteraceae bacterium]
MSDALPSALAQVLKRRPITPGPGFAPLPEPRGPAPYRHALADVLGADELAGIERRGQLRFHCVGDTGGWHDGHPQHLVAAAMADELAGSRPAQFFYHLGDVVYPHGEESHYRGQFFSAYGAYHAPIFAIPGNHDAEAPSMEPSKSLSPFLRTFCSTSSPLHDVSVDVCRPPADQPHVHWTLVHDWMWIIGLYTNVPEDGEVDAVQLEWLTGELQAAPEDVTLIVAAHRPVYSVDVVHGSNLELGDALDSCFARAGRIPDAVFGAHAHNYQRFTRRMAGRAVPYVVAGSGGFHERHRLGAGLPRTPGSFPGLSDVTLDAHASSAHGFMTVAITPSGGDVIYQTVSDAGARNSDAFVIRRAAASR